MVFFILVLCPAFLIPLILKGEFVGEETREYSADLIFCWNLIRVKYRKGRPIILRISWLEFKLESEKEIFTDEKKKEEVEPGKVEKKGFSFKGKDKITDLRFIRRNLRRALRIIKKVFHALTISGFIRCRYSLTDPALDGELLGYFYSFFYAVNPSGLTFDIFPVFGSSELVLRGSARLDIRTRIFRLLYAGTRVFKDINYIRKEFS